jgi:hypothetical protein
MKIRPLERPKCRWENNIKKGVKCTGLEDVEWVYLGQCREGRRAFVQTVMKFGVT